METEIAIASPLSAASGEPLEAEKLLKSALASRPELVGMELRVKAADAAVTAASGGWFPQVFLTGNYYYARPNQRVIPAVDTFNDTWDFGISLQLDLWNNLSTLHQASQAKAQREQARDALGAMRDGIVLEVTQCYLNWQQAKERITLSELSVQQANENYRMASEKFKMGMMTSSDLLDAANDVAAIETPAHHRVRGARACTGKTRKSRGSIGRRHMSANTIEVEHLTKRFGKCTAVDNISFKVKEGEIFGFRSGAGLDAFGQL